MKKIVFSKEQIDEIIKIYKNDNIGLAKIGDIYGVSKLTIKRILLENNVEIVKPGQRFKGGKLEVRKRYYQKNKTKLSNKYKKWAEKNKEHLKNYSAEWHEKNREHTRKYKREYQRKILSENHKYRLSQRFRNSIHASLKGKRVSSVFQWIGYSLDELMNHLETLFSEGMSWNNYGEWHIDHIIPISKFNFVGNDCDGFRECWSLSNLQPMWAKDNYSKNNRIIAHQYKVRKEKEKDSLSFYIGKISLKKTKVEVIDREICEKIINEYEWLGYMPKETNLHFGIYFKTGNDYHLGGVVAYEPEFEDNFNYSDKIIKLSRGACLWWTPKNTASYFITRTLEWLKKNTAYKVVNATVNPSAGEVGIIYQSLNWHYIGSFDGNRRIRYGYKIDNKIYEQRHISEIIGNADKENVMKHFPNAQMINLGVGNRYFKFIGDKRENREMMKSIKHLVKPYPQK